MLVKGEITAPHTYSTTATVSVVPPWIPFHLTKVWPAGLFEVYTFIHCSWILYHVVPRAKICLASQFGCCVTYRTISAVRKMLTGHTHTQGHSIWCMYTQLFMSLLVCTTERVSSIPKPLLKEHTISYFGTGLKSWRVQLSTMDVILWYTGLCFFDNSVYIIGYVGMVQSNFHFQKCNWLFLFGSFLWLKKK